MDNTRSVLFFPLRTNVEYFRSDTAYLSLLGRIKQSLLLYDELIFQKGVYHCTVGPEGAIDGVRPFLRTDHRKEFSDDVKSERFWINIRRSDAGPDVPFKTILDSPLQRYHKSQFHLILEEMKENGIEEVSIVPFAPSPKAKSWASRQGEADLSRIEVSPDEKNLYKIILRNLNLDLLLMSELNCAGSLDPLHSAIIQQIWQGRSIKMDVPGFISLDLLFPYVGDLSWQQVAEFRHEELVREFRKKLSELEEIARSIVGEGSRSDLESEISRLLLDELLEEISERMNTAQDVLADYGREIVLEVVGSFFPPASLIEIGHAAASAMKELVEVESQRSSWLVAFMKMRSYQ